MDSIFWLLVVLVVVGGVIAGLSFDVALVKLPTRKRIGPVAYAQFARGNDLGNGKVLYPVLGIATLLLVAATAIAAWVNQISSQIALPITVVVVCTVLHSLCSAKAAPIMLSLAKTPDTPKILKEKLDTFAFWHGFRAAFQMAAFIATLWALVAFLGDS